ncbi:hypothetical protein M0802_004270 [Mischocyttarus mexicanus]|nr:hypothetical protein M0802_004270 [Mischocyttarus mexicanus]
MSCLKNQNALRCCTSWNDNKRFESVYDLLVTSVTPTDDQNFYIDDGLDGFPAFGFRPGSEVKQPYRLYLPEKLPAEFTLVAIFKPISFRTSYLFAVLNPFETVVQLGIRISDGPGSNQNISLVYTNSDEHSLSEEVAKFTVPKLTKKWSKIVIKVSINDVILYLNCHEMARQRVTRIPLELVFDTASTLYMAQAGPHIQERFDCKGQVNGNLLSQIPDEVFPQQQLKLSDCKVYVTDRGLSKPPGIDGNSRRNMENP